MLLWILIFLLPRIGLSVMTQTLSHQDERKDGDVSPATRPHIYRCRSPNMEEFTCWWHPLHQPPESHVDYTLTYSLEKASKQECPDYESAGPNSCHFDKRHTSVWKMYCMEVTAVTPQGNHTSQQKCVDVQEIVELEAPVNLTYTLLNGSKDDDGRTVKVSWVYPVPDHIQFGWISLDFELQYRHISEPTNWKVKGLLQEFSLDLLDLPAGEYLVQVRCRPRRHGLWSRWSSALPLTIPGRSASDRLLALLLVTGVGVMALLVIGCGVLPHSRRIKAFLLPPIPRPRISGIDPLLVKKGSMEEINRHFLSLHGFHGYKPASYSDEFWDMVSSDGNQTLHGNPGNQTLHGNPGFKGVEGRLNMAASGDPTPTATQTQPPVTPNPNPYIQGHLQGPFSYCQSTTWVSQPLDSAPAELLSFPGSDYSLMATPARASTFKAASSTSQDFYTCVNGLSPAGEVQLVPCLATSARCPYVQLKGQLKGHLAEERAEKSHQLADYLARKVEMVTHGRVGMKEGGAAENSQAVVPLLPDATTDTV